MMSIRSASIITALKSKTFNHTLITIPATFINGILGILFFIYIARVLGPLEFGIFSVSVAFLTLTSDIVDLGINTGIINFVGKFAHVDKIQAYKYLKLALYLKLLIYLIVLILGVVLAPIIANLIFLKPALSYPLTLSVIGVGGALLFSFITNSLQAFQKYISWGVINISSNALRLLAAIILASFFSLTAIEGLYVYIAVPFAAFFAGLFLLPRNFLKIKNESSVFKDFFKYNIWVGVSTIIAAVSSRMDTFLVARMLPIDQIGIYSVAVQLTSIMPQFVYAIASVAAPKIASLDSHEKAIEYLKKLQILVFLFSVFVLLAIPVASFLIPVFYSESYSMAVSPFIVLALSQVIFLISLPAHQAIFYYFSKPKIFAYTSLLNLIIISLVGYMLMPRLGIMGASIASLMGSLINLVIPVIYVILKFSKNRI